MCRRTDCKYICGAAINGNGLQERGGGNRPCDYHRRMGKTRLAILTKKYGLPTTHKKIRKLMSGEHCPFFEPDDQKKRIENPYGVARDMPKTGRKKAEGEKEKTHVVNIGNKMSINHFDIKRNKY